MWLLVRRPEQGKKGKRDVGRDMEGWFGGKARYSINILVGRCRGNVKQMQIRHSGRCEMTSYLPGHASVERDIRGRERVRGRRTERDAMLWHEREGCQEMRWPYLPAPPARKASRQLTTRKLAASPTYVARADQQPSGIPMMSARGMTVYADTMD
jgi:hypothetical protein